MLTCSACGVRVHALYFGLCAGCCAYAHGDLPNEPTVLVPLEPSVPRCGWYYLTREFPAHDDDFWTAEREEMIKRLEATPSF